MVEDGTANTTVGVCLKHVGSPESSGLFILSQLTWQWIDGIQVIRHSSTLEHEDYDVWRIIPGTFLQGGTRSLRDDQRANIDWNLYEAMWSKILRLIRFMLGCKAIPMPHADKIRVVPQGLPSSSSWSKARTETTSAWWRQDHHHHELAFCLQRLWSLAWQGLTDILLWIMMNHSRWSCSFQCASTTMLLLPTVETAVVV